MPVNCCRRVIPGRLLPLQQRLRWQPRPRPRRRLCCSIAEDQSDKEAQFRQVVSARVEEAGKLLDEIIDDIVCDLSTVQSIGYIYEEIPSETESEIIKSVVGRFLNRLDQNFLASLSSFEQRSEDMGHSDVAQLINKIQTEVVAQINGQFPPEVLLLEALMRMPEKKERIAAIKRSAEKPSTAAPPSSTHPTTETSREQDIYMDVREESLEDMNLKEELERLQVLKTEGLKSLKEELEKTMEMPEATQDVTEMMDAVEDPLEDCELEMEEDSREDDHLGINPLRLGLAANQFIVDMEEKEDIPNRQLLAKLCVIREEVRLVEMEMRFAGVKMDENPLKLRENVPSQVMGIIQILIKTKDPIKRIGFLREAFEKDKYGPSTKDLSRSPGYVRPGIFMTSLTMAQMHADERSKQKTTAKEMTPLLMQRFEDVRLEAMLVLREIGWGAYTIDELTQQQKDRTERERAIKEEFLIAD